MNILKTLAEQAKIDNSLNNFNEIWDNIRQGGITKKGYKAYIDQEKGKVIQYTENIPYTSNKIYCDFVKKDGCYNNEFIIYNLDKYYPKGIKFTMYIYEDWTIDIKQPSSMDIYVEGFNNKCGKWKINNIEITNVELNKNYKEMFNNDFFSLCNEYALIIKTPETITFEYLSELIDSLTEFKEIEVNVSSNYEEKRLSS